VVTAATHLASWWWCPIRRRWWKPQVQLLGWLLLRAVAGLNWCGGGGFSGWRGRWDANAPVEIYRQALSCVRAGCRSTARLCKLSSAGQLRKPNFYSILKIVQITIYNAIQSNIQCE